MWGVASKGKIFRVNTVNVIYYVFGRYIAYTTASHQFEVKKLLRVKTTINLLRRIPRTGKDVMHVPQLIRIVKVTLPRVHVSFFYPVVVVDAEISTVGA